MPRSENEHFPANQRWTGPSVLCQGFSTQVEVRLRIVGSGSSYPLCETTAPQILIKLGKALDNDKQ